VLSALTTYPALWAAGVDIVGIANFVTLMGLPNSHFQQYPRLLPVCCLLSSGSHGDPARITPSAEDQEGKNPKFSPLFSSQCGVSPYYALYISLMRAFGGEASA